MWASGRRTNGVSRFSWIMKARFLVSSPRVRGFDHAILCDAQSADQVEQYRTRVPT